CRLLLARPDMLLLDEPTNHLDAESVAWLERFLKEYPGTVVAVTHDRYFLDNVAGWILELDRGHGIPWEGNYSSWLEQKQERLAREEKADAARQRTLARELEWVRMAPRARQAKGKARLKNYEAMLAESGDQRAQTLEITIPAGPRLGDVVVEADGVSKAYGDRVLIDKLAFKLPRGALVDFAGCALVITHDRWFLDRIATHILAFEDEGRVVWFEGNYADYEADRRKRLGAEAERPHRLKYKRLPRA